MKRMVLIFALVLLILFTIAYSRENNILQIDLVVYKNDTVVFKEVKLTFGSPSQLPSREGNYSLKVLDASDRVLYERRMKLDFVIFSEPPVITDHNTVFDKIEYDPSMRKVQLLHNNQIIFSKELNFCNNNGICEDYIGEDISNCAHDCKEARGFPWYFVEISFVILIVIVVFILLKRRQTSSWNSLYNKWR